MEPGLLVSIAAAILLFGRISKRAERSILTPPIFFVVVGLCIGEAGVGWLDAETGRAVLHPLAELTLVLVLFIDAARIDLSCLRREESLPLRLLAIALPLTVVLGALLALFVFPTLRLWEAVLLAAILTPTDAALGQAVVSNPLVPTRIRQTLNVESGLNDGLVLPLVLIAASLAGTEAGAPWTYWAEFVLYQLTLGPAVGVFVGYVGGQLVGRGTQTGWINEPFQRLSVLGVSGLAFGGAELLGGNGFIAVFVAGLTLGNTARGMCTCLFEFGEAEGQLLTLAVFLLFGGIMVPQALPHWDTASVVYVIASLTVVRMLPVAFSLMGTGLHTVSLAFLGWFGPRGLASILFLLLVVEEQDLRDGGMLEAITVLAVFLSILAHGVTAYPFARRYGRFVTAVREPADPEHQPAMEMPVRIRHAASRD